MTENKDEKVLQEVLDTLKPLKGILDVGVLNEDVKKNVLQIEAERTGDLIPVINLGVKECLERQYTVAIIKNTEFRPPPTPTVQFVDNKGNLLGEEIVNAEQKRKYEENGEAKLFQNDFVLLKDKNDIEEDLKSQRLEENPTKQAFVLPPVQFIEIEELEDTDDVVSSSPDPLADLFLKKYFGFEDDPKLASLLVGFDIKEK